MSDFLKVSIVKRRCVIFKIIQERHRKCSLLLTETVVAAVREVAGNQVGVQARGIPFSTLTRVLFLLRRGARVCDEFEVF